MKRQPDEEKREQTNRLCRTFVACLMAVPLIVSCSSTVAPGGHSICDLDSDCDPEHFLGCGKDGFCEQRKSYNEVCERDGDCVGDTPCVTPDGWEQSICAVECEASCPDGTECGTAIGYCVETCRTISDCMMGLMCADGLCQEELESDTTTEEVEATRARVLR